MRVRTLSTCSNKKSPCSQVKNCRQGDFYYGWKIKDVTREERLNKTAASLHLRQDLRAPRKNWLSRQFLNSLCSNRRNCYPPSPAFSSCGPSRSNKSLEYNHCRHGPSATSAKKMSLVTLLRTLRFSSRLLFNPSLLAFLFLTATIKGPGRDKKHRG